MSDPDTADRRAVNQLPGKEVWRDLADIAADSSPDLCAVVVEIDRQLAVFEVEGRIDEAVEAAAEEATHT
jgi:hypothetical protein